MRYISTFVRALAIMGVLLHAGLIVWHNAAMLGSSLQRSALAASLAETCHGAGATTKVAHDERSDLPPSNGDEGGCPICKGQLSAVAVLPVVHLQRHRLNLATARMEVVGHIITLRLLPVRPPTRGPPATV